MLPLAHALRDAGHAVAFATTRSFRPHVERAGFQAFPIGLDWSMGDPAHPRPPYQVLDGFPHWSNWITQTARPNADDLLLLGKDWRPDVIVHDPAEYGAAIVGDRLGIPHATVAVGGWVSDYLRRLEVAPLLEALRADYGLPPDPDTEMPFRYLHLAFMPRSFADPDRPLPPTAHFFRPDFVDGTGEERLPAWIETLPDHPTVYATLGTTFGHRADVFSAILNGLRDEPITLILTVGRHHDPRQFGPQPEHVHIAGYVPQSLLLPRCDLVVAQAGLSTVLGSLAHGLPMVMVPLAADQPIHAGRCAALGAGLVIPPAEIAPESIRAGVRAVLGEPGYRAQARRVRDEMASQPGAEQAVTLVERLARDRQPIPSPGQVTTRPGTG